MIMVSGATHVYTCVHLRHGALLQRLHNSIRMHDTKMYMKALLWRAVQHLLARQCCARTRSLSTNKLHELRLWLNSNAVFRFFVVLSAFLKSELIGCRRDRGTGDVAYETDNEINIYDSIGVMFHYVWIQFKHPPTTLSLINHFNINCHTPQFRPIQHARRITRDRWKSTSI